MVRLCKQACFGTFPSNLFAADREQASCQKRNTTHSFTSASIPPRFETPLKSADYFVTLPFAVLWGALLLKEHGPRMGLPATVVVVMGGLLLPRQMGHLFA